MAGNTQGLIRGHQPMGESESGGFGPAVRVRLAVDVRNMALHRSDAQHQLRGYNCVALSRRQEEKHLDFSLGEAGRVCGGPGWPGRIVHL